MQVRNVLHATHWNTGRKESPKIRHLRTIAQLCWAVSSQLWYMSTIGKKLLKQQYLRHMSSQNGELQPTSGWDRFGCLWHPSKFQRVSRLRYCSDVAQRKPTKLCTMYGRLLGPVHYIYIFGGCCPVTEFCKVQNSLRPSLTLSYIGSVTARHT